MGHTRVFRLHKAHERSAILSSFLIERLLCPSRLPRAATRHEDEFGGAAGSCRWLSRFRRILHSCIFQSAGSSGFARQSTDLFYRVCFRRRYLLLHSFRMAPNRGSRDLLLRLRVAAASFHPWTAGRICNEEPEPYPPFTIPLLRIIFPHVHPCPRRRRHLRG